MVLPNLRVRDLFWLVMVIPAFAHAIEEETSKPDLQLVRMTEDGKAIEIGVFDTVKVLDEERLPEEKYLIVNRWNYETHSLADLTFWELNGKRINAETAKKRIGGAKELPVIVVSDWYQKEGRSPLSTFRRYRAVFRDETLIVGRPDGGKIEERIVETERAD